MRTHYILQTIAVAIVCMLCQVQSFAQTPAIIDPVGTAAFNRYGEVATAGFLGSNNVRRVGIGNFSNANPPSSAFHINAFLLSPVLPAFPNFFLPGEVFRTDGTNTNINAWRMFTGPTVATTAERLAIFTQANSTDVVFRSTSGNMFFQWFNNPAGASMQINRNFGGVVGIGDYAAFSPRSWLHLHDGVGPTYMQVTNNFTGAATPNDGAKFGTNPINVGGPFINIPFTEIRQEENAPLAFFTAGQERMRIMGNLNQNVQGVNPNTNINPGFVGIGCTNPMSRLHVGGNSTFFANGNPADGYRPWMVEGLFTYQNSDNMYFGHHNVTGDAVINWGNNPVAAGAGDRLLFVFTAATNILPPQPFASGANGLEGARMITNGNIVFTGFGGDPNNPNQNPYTANPDPGNTVEINSVAINAAAPGGSSGLRFTDLNSGSPTIANPGPGVLTVNTAGDVIYVPGAVANALTNAHNGTSLSTLAPATVAFGQNVNQAANPGQLLNNREVPLNSNFLAVTQTTPDLFTAGKVGFGIAPGNIGVNALRNSDITMQVNGSISIFDGTGNTSLFFGEDQRPQGSGELGEWGMHYDLGPNGGLNFWKPSPSSGYGFGNRFLFLCDNGNVGVGATAGPPPANALQITSYPFNPYAGNPAGTSGLRLTNMVANNTPMANPGAGVLSVDAAGDVIYVPGGGVTGLCPAPLITGNAGSNLNNFNFYFEGQGGVTNRVGVGIPCNTALGAKLDVLQNAGLAGQIGVRGTVGSVNPGALQIGVEGNAFGANRQIGVRGFVQNAPGQSQIGGNFIAQGSTSNNTGMDAFASGAGVVNIGGNYIASAGSTNYGGLFNAIGTATTLNYGIYTSVVPQATAGSFAAYFNGNITGVGVNSYASDAVFKENVVAVSNPLNTIRQLEPHKYNFKTNDFPYLGLPRGNHFGLIAQEVESVVPELVMNVVHPAQFDAEGNEVSPQLEYKGINYNGLIPITLAAVKELDLAVTALQNAPAGISGSGTTNFLTKWSGASTVTSSQVFDNGTNVGIGTAAPANKLSVAGSSDFSGDMSVGETGSPANLFVTAQPFFGSGGIFVNNANSGNTLATLGMMDNENGVMRLYTSTPNFGGIRTEITSAASYFLGNVGIGTPSPTEKLHVAGNIFASGTITQNSDVRLKQNIAALSDGIEIINQLEPRTFNFDTAQYGWLNLPGGMQRGLVAQEVELLLPELITASFYPEVKDSAGNVIHPRVDYKGINYTALIPVLIRAVKEQQSKITQLESTVAGCCASNAPKFSEGLRSSDLELASKSAVLWQNFPNPFGDGTVIRYYVPETTASANIVFYDEFGNEIKNTGLPYKGEKAELNLSTLNLASGIYSYSLVVNGKIVDTKRMIRAK